MIKTIRVEHSIYVKGSCLRKTLIIRVWKLIMASTVLRDNKNKNDKQDGVVTNGTNQCI